MSGHNKWSQIKHQKETTDQKRSRLFSKILNTISIFAREDSNPQFNVQLRSAIQKAKDANIPQDNIERAIRRASDPSEILEELIFEAYSENGIAILIEAITNNRNRTVAEIKKIISDHNGKWAESGSVLWAFEKKQNGAERSWQAKFTGSSTNEENLRLQKFIEALLDHQDVQNVFTNAELAGN
jgi:YebC/PmpR family DNA-binding regulatory protein